MHNLVYLGVFAALAFVSIIAIPIFHVRRAPKEDYYARKDLENRLRATIAQIVSARLGGAQLVGAVLYGSDLTKAWLWKA